MASSSCGMTSLVVSFSTSSAYQVGVTPHILHVCTYCTSLQYLHQFFLSLRCEEQSPKSVFLQHKTKSLVRVKNIGTYSFKIEIAISCTPCKISTSVYLCFCTKHRSEPKVSVSFTDAFIFMLFICRLVSLKSPVTRHLSDGGWRMEDSISSDTETKIVKSSDIRSKFFFYSHILE